MRNSRKTLLNVLMDNLFCLFDLALITLLIIFIINKSFLYIPPLFIAFTTSIFRLVLNIKHYVVYKPFDWTCHVLIDGQETEKRYDKVEVGDLVCVYPKEIINYTGLVKSGMLFVDESKISGETRTIKKGIGDRIRQGSIIVNGNGVIEILSLDRQIARPNKVQNTFFVKALKMFNDILGGIIVLLIVLTLIFNKENLYNTALGCVATLPFFMNLLITIYLYIESKTYHTFKANDLTGIANFGRMDTFCFDKTGTITDLQFEVFKTIPIQSQSLNQISLDTNRALSQIVSDVIKSTNEKGGYYSALRNYFIYDVSKVVEFSSPIYENGFYSVASFKGNKIYAIGSEDSFDLSNNDSIAGLINEYKALGYYVLVVAEAKTISETGLIEGKSVGIGLIIIQETVRENVKQMIKNIYKNGGDIKVISGDTLANTAEVCRKAGIENTDKAVAINKMPFEQLDLIVDETIIFADASMSQKAYIVEQLKKHGRKVTFIGDGDNDTQAMKASDLAITVSGSSESAHMCSHITLKDDFVYDQDTINRCRKVRNNVLTIMLLNLSQSVFASVIGTIFFICNLVNKTIVNPFTYDHLVFWALFGAFIPSVLILLNRKSDENAKVSFKRNLIANSLLYMLPVAVIYLFQLLQYYGVGFIAITSDYNEMHEMLITSQTANNLCYLSLILAAMFIVYRMYQPLNNFRILALLGIYLIPLVYFILIGFGVNNLESITNIKTSIITPVQFFVGLAITIIAASLHLLILQIIKTLRGDKDNAKN